jgi:N-acetylglucosamine malate deacetylase 1
MAVDVLIIGAHPDDAELCSGGFIARLVKSGKSVGIVDLTRGEMGTRGTPEIRAQEAERARLLLGISTSENLGLPDGRLEATDDAKRLVIEAIRRARPGIVVAPHAIDLHPDHAVTGRIVEQVRYLCAMPKWPADGEPCRVPLVLRTMFHTQFDPDLVVDVTDVYEAKIEAIRCYASQLHDPGTAEAGPGTNIGRPDFMDRWEARHRYWGERIGVTYGEPYAVDGPLPVRNTAAFLEVLGG